MATKILNLENQAGADSQEALAEELRETCKVLKNFAHYRKRVEQ